MPKLTIYDIEGKEAGNIELPAAFDKKVNEAVIHQVVVMYQANQRQGTLDTKTRSQVSGGNKKPFRQKGTGQARAGSTRSPLFHRGGIVFGPHPRDFSFSVPRKIRIAALREVLKAKFKSESLICVDPFVVKSGKTKDYLAITKNLKIAGKKTLALLEGAAPEVAKASRNVRGVNIVKSSEVNTLDILKSNKILATKAAIEQLLKRLQ
jgi:large subunit ribosomal protein L4